ncbi:hypothetical protein [Oceanicola sp. 502str15]|uniref:hypothetical protein n=1 Tax=Oceanicola sp. 502str15 TaxID=2696061 RepID=UPI002094C67D|nr:hypothetical protein [Oceanicola sp. 502str15]MCO6383826.1 hypothetical protein [Oceanicola sp. 502str15]
MRLAALLLMLAAAPAGANPGAIGDAIGLCRAVVEAESPEPLEAAGLELVRRFELGAPQWGAIYGAPGRIGTIGAGLDELNRDGRDMEEVHCYLALPAPTRSSQTRWEKLAMGPVMALEAEGFERHGGTPASPGLRKCPMIGKPTFVRLYTMERTDPPEVRVWVTDTGPSGQTCKE